MRILIGTPVRQSPAILECYLNSLRDLEKDGLRVEYAFVDDNTDPASTKLLEAFRDENERVTLLAGIPDNQLDYDCDDDGHGWNHALFAKVAFYKDQIINMAREGLYDGLFFVDSDLVLHPKILTHLTKQDLDIVSSVFWTKWTPDAPAMPQVWVTDEYNMYHPLYMDNPTSVEEANEHAEHFVTQLKKPGTYEVGGLGALTLISKRAIDRHVSFAQIHNLSLQGEDRHFCVRAVASGLRLFADTHYPALHLYRESDLKLVDSFKAEIADATERIAACKTFEVAMQSWGTMHHETFTGLEGIEHFTPELQQNTLDLVDDMKDLINKTKTVNRYHVLWSQQFGDDGRRPSTGHMRVEAAIVQRGWEDGQRTNKLLVADGVMIKDGDDWKVRELGLEPIDAPVTPPIPFNRKSRNNRVLLTTLVKNEADNYLRRVLTHTASFVDEVLIIDDGSSDNTVEVCESILKDTPHTIIQLEQSEFHHEYTVRQKQWQLATTSNADWILNLDADEMFEDRMRSEIRRLINQDEYDAFAFRLFDFWNDTHYREDEYWSAHLGHMPFLVRNDPNIADDWKQTDQHCGRFPLAVMDMQILTSRMRVKHYGWANAETRQAKYNRYKLLDPDQAFGIPQQYESILDANPRLIKWEEQEVQDVNVANVA